MPDAPNTRYDIASFGELVSDPSRVAMLLSLLDGLTRPASELAGLAGVSASTASAHLKRLLQGKLIRVERLGRHRYFKLADAHVADALEAMALHAPARKQTRPLHRDRQIFTNARTCYQHLAGKLGVAWLAALEKQKLIAIGEGAFKLSARGIARCEALGLTSPQWPGGKPCLDWTERQSHLGGPLGSVLTQEMLRLKWLSRHQGGRAVRLTALGRKKLAQFGVAQAAILL